MVLVLRNICIRRKRESWPLHCTIKKVPSRCIGSLSVKFQSKASKREQETVLKLTRKNVNRTSKALTLKEKIDQLGYIKIKKLYVFQRTHLREWKRLATKWEKTFSIHIPNKRLVPRTYEELLQMN